eukprot:gnl/TRDRNA2_/TRDRNA2_181649_c0_seq1.p1 gnl/TRDRNA2_/TRDRNA2_181649_c0~~gnl/TRDRNA2_/TRDRNA2_181649_c0_seq1.p1  ORF type:complete len:385 (-),score=21.14 gnl/TRDRNA2_/TRDRNA2_181649_c0_seq1:38-1192(-)
MRSLPSFALALFCSAKLAPCKVQALRILERKADPLGGLKTYPHGSRTFLPEDSASLTTAEDEQSAQPMENFAWWGSSPIELCAEKKSLPILYLLGAQSAATTTVAMDLVRHLNVGGVNNTKEWHWFDGGDGSRQHWLDALPACRSRSSLLADMTPRNLRLTPLPPGVAPTGSWQTLNVPQKIHEFYGTQLLQRLTFVVTLREPLSRLQSCYYHAKLLGFVSPRRSGVWADLRADNFTDAVRKSLLNATRAPRLTYADGLWGSMYALHLGAWVQYVPSQRFVIIPFRSYFKQPKTALQEIAARMGGVRPDIHIRSMVHANKHGHPPLDQDIDHDVRMEYDRFMSKENAKLISILSMMHARGAYLHGFSGQSDDEASLRSWLEASW